LRLFVRPVQSSENTTSTPKGAALNVLIVEDEMLIAFDLELQVEAAGHRVVGMAVNLVSCQAAARTCTPDVALMDLRLKGGESGEDVARWLRNEMGVRCIFLSGNLDEARCDRLRALDPVAFVGKPVLAARLAEALARVVPAGIHSQNQ
jgi:DNA-binding NarL/FixJ family response regulator